MQSLRILHVTPYYADAWGYGGIPRLSAALARALARRGHDITVCTTDACDAAARLPGPDSCRTDGVQVRVFSNVSNRLAYRLQFFLPRGLNRYLARHAGRFDVAHLHACHNVPGAIASWHLRRAGVPYVLAPNGTAARIERRRMAKAVFDAIAGARVVDGAARLVAVSPAEARQLRALGIDPTRIREIPNPIDVQEFAAPRRRGRWRGRHGLGERPIVMYLGTLTPRKRVDTLARAFAALADPDAALVIAGNDMGSGRQVRAVVSALGLERRTVWTGLLRGPERLDALADADVVSYATEDEIFGLVPLEALMVGTPVVVANDSGCGEVIATTGGGLCVPPGAVEPLAAALRAILAAQRRWRAAACDAAGTIRALYGDDPIAERVEAVYREIAVTAG